MDREQRAVVARPTACIMTGAEQHVNQWQQEQLQRISSKYTEKGRKEQ
jgi:hypothetical protein